MREPIFTVRPVQQVPWSIAAACKSQDTSVFFPASKDDERAAKAICATCAVQPQCRDLAIANRETDGIWGGMTGAERQAFVQAKRVAS